MTTPALSELEAAWRESDLSFAAAPEPRSWRYVRRASRLVAHDRYLTDWLAFVRGSSRRRSDASHVVVPTDLAFWQFHPIHHPRQPAAVQRVFERGMRRIAARGQHVVLPATGDFGQRRRHRLEMSQAGRVYPEPYPWLASVEHLLVFEQVDGTTAPGDVGMLPYSVADDQGGAAGAATRDVLLSFAGALAYPELPPQHVRAVGNFETLRGQGPDRFVGTQSEAYAAYGLKQDSDLFQRSVFTLCPAGYGRWTFRLGQALRAGSIPVLLADDYLLPHADHIDWDSLVIRLPESEWATSEEYVRSVAPQEIASRQEALRASAHLFSARAVHLMTALDIARRDA